MRPVKRVPIGMQPVSFVRTNEVEYIQPFMGDGLTDTKGRFLPFETEPNELHRIAAMDTPPFHEIYQIISN